MNATIYQFRPNAHWNIVSREVYLVLERAGYQDRLRIA